MGCVDSHLQRYGSGEAKMRKLRGGRADKAAGGGERDGEVNTNKTGKNGMGKEW